MNQLAVKRTFLLTNNPGQCISIMRLAGVAQSRHADTWYLMGQAAYAPDSNLRLSIFDLTLSIPSFTNGALSIPLRSFARRPSP